MKKIFFFLLVCCIFCTGQTITILHTNDHHGHLESFRVAGQHNVGGMAARMSLIESIRFEVAQKGGSILLLDCGDINTGEPVSDMLMGKPDIELMNLMGYQAMALGNHEFDLTLENLLQQASLANFPYLATNVVYKETKKPIFPGSKIFEVQGIKIGVFALSHPETGYISTHGKDERIEFIDPALVLPNIIKELREKVDFIIALTHLDHGTIVELVKQFPGIDLVLAGHNHLFMMEPMQIGNSWLVEAGEYGISMGRWDIEFKDKKAVHMNYRLLGINLDKPLEESGKIVCMNMEEKFADHPVACKVLNKYLKETEKLLAEPLGEIKEDIYKNSKLEPFKSSPLGNLLCDAIKEQCNVDIVLQNMGGVRSDLLSGTATYKTVLTILPFTNSMYIYELTGKEILEIFKHMASGSVQPGGYLEIAGLYVRLKEDTVETIQYNNKPLEMDKKYRVAINSFMATGGDGYYMFPTYKGIDTGFILSSILKQHIVNHSPITANRELRIDWKDNKQEFKKE
ncbi:MAG: 5'-nucleotidase C-terminal domain-containing protein [Planctomycetes bacterium]|mgnify:CR=1 FL=1|jgi:5'-nucleotidase/UDP-sugar diphosphatase|nr:5'-nucleotidase C-terminal domain-containing protein [Planctomycetota bacterium]HPY75381.1 5'-nucleotidase C-terminal domain-containing protein [Planctomycetota bacterium]HQB01005.1 5'-nucleotidase C-terminal domain-containing protein [Planctomycetota bacterium]